MLKIVEKTKIWFTISLILIVIGIGFMVTKGLNFGIDFKGGTLIEINMGKTFTESEKKDIDAIIKKYDKGASTNTANNFTEIDVKSNSQNLNESNVKKMVNEIKKKYTKASLKSQERIGAVIGNELKTKALTAVILATIAMLIYVGIRFEFKFGLAAIIALVHDVLITLSFYAIFRVQLDSPFIAAILTIVGYSINDTIVVFDRIRENMKKMRKADINEVTNVSINQTMTRSINTVITTLFTIIAVTIFVPPVRSFGKPLIVGILSGCYSSIFIASPMWVFLKKHLKGKKKTAKIKSV